MIGYRYPGSMLPAEAKTEADNRLSNEYFRALEHAIRLFIEEEISGHNFGTIARLTSRLEAARTLYRKMQ